MNWIYYILAAVVLILSIAQIFLDYILKHIFKDARTSEHKKTRTILLCVTLTAFIGSQVVSWINSQQKDQEAKRTITDLRWQITGLKSQITNLSSQISAEGSSTRREVRQEFQSLATNSSTPPAQRLAILRGGPQKLDHRLR
jgi:ABC-type transport system involved in cytochrome bd biosynthesis fused ATPase/permease subunit